MPEAKALLTTRQAAEYLDTTPQTINRWARDGKLNPVVQGDGRTGTRFYATADVEALAASTSTASTTTS